MRIIIEAIDGSGATVHAADPTELHAVTEPTGAGFGALSLTGHDVTSIYDEESSDGVGAASFGDAAPDMPDISTGLLGHDPDGFGAVSMGDGHAAEFIAGPTSGDGFGAVSFDE